MSSASDREQKARAERLHRQIEELKSEAIKKAEDQQSETPRNPSEPQDAASQAGSTSQSPREFIHRKMRELREQAERSDD